MDTSLDGIEEIDLPVTPDTRKIPVLIPFSLSGTKKVVSFSLLKSRGDNFLTKLVENHFCGDLTCPVWEGYLHLDQNPEIFSELIDFLKGSVKHPSNQLIVALDFYQIPFTPDKKEETLVEKLQSVSLLSQCGFVACAAYFFNKNTDRIVQSLKTLAENGTFTVELRLKFEKGVHTSTFETSVGVTRRN